MSANYFYLNTAAYVVFKLLCAPVVDVAFGTEPRNESVQNNGCKQHARSLHVDADADADIHTAE